MIKKRGLSGVVSVVVIIALVMAAGIMVWTFVENMVTDRMESTESCYEASDKVEINNDYTCYEITNDSLRLYISVKDISLDEILIAVNSEGPSKTITIGKQARNLEGISNYPSRSGAVAVPGKNEGSAYLITGLDGMSRENIRVSISPSVNGNQCDTVDTVNNLWRC